MRVKEGEIGCASFAAISKHVIPNIGRGGAFLPLAARFIKYESARLTARYKVSRLYYLIS